MESSAALSADSLEAPTYAFSAEDFRKFPLLAGLAHESQREVFAQAKRRDFAGGKTIFTAGDEEDWTYFLLSGKLELRTGDVKVRSIEAGSEAREPLAPETPRTVGAHALTDCSILCIPTSFLEAAGAITSKEEVYAVTEFHSNDNFENQVRFSILEEFANDKFEVPSLPEVALKIRKAVEDPDITAAAVERLVAADPAVTARLLQVANSPAYAGSKKIESCRDAVTRLGLPTTRELITGLLLRNLFDSKIPAISQRLKAVWAHSTHVAAIAFQLAKMSPAFNPDRALLAGLVHDIGTLPVLKKIEADWELVRSADELERLIGQLRGEVGALVLRHWDFSEDIVKTALEAEDWHRDHEGPADYCDLIIVAQLFSYMGTPQFSKLPTVGTLSAFKRLNLENVDPEQTLGALDRARTSIDELRRILA
ncbi:MAG: HDOD domain-containing protein [Gammaproteobacteria bacterium]|nr:HDOD domain-containing protein [Gammaproteobacteria bacterium]